MRTFTHGEGERVAPNFDPVIIDSGPSERGWSYYSRFLRCPMLFFWATIYAKRRGLGWDDTTPALARGTLVHVGLAHHHARIWARARGKDPDKIPAPVEAMTVKATRLGEIGQSMLPVACRMVEAYLRNYAHETPSVVAVEEPMSITFGPALYTARIDRAVEENGKVFIYDTKTTQSFQNKTIRKYTLHGQFFGQHYLGRHYYGERFGGVVVDVIDEAGTCVRRRPDPAPFALRHFPQVVEHAHEAIEACKAAYGADPERWAALACPDEQICVSPYGYCPAFELCRYGGQP